MRAPLTKIEESEAIWAIVRAIKPLNRPAAEAAPAVETKLRIAMKVRAPTFGQRGTNRKLAKRISTHLAEIEKAIAGAEDGSLLALFAVALWPEGKRPEEIAESTELDDWAFRICADMAALNRACQIILREPIGKPIGDYHDADACKKVAAGAAFELVLELSTELPTSSSPDSPLRAVATLVYEHLTGQKHVDLEAYCDTLVGLDLSLRKNRKINPDKS